MRNATHQEAVAALIANVSLIKLLVRHDPPPKGLQVRQSIGNRSFRPNVDSPEVVSPGRKSIRPVTILSSHESTYDQAKQLQVNRPSCETTIILIVFLYTRFLSCFFDKLAVREQFDKKILCFLLLIDPFL